MNKSLGRVIVFLIVLALAVVILRSCAASGNSANSANTNADTAATSDPYASLAGIDPTKLARIKDNCGPFGMPAPLAGATLGSTTLIGRDGYVLLHSNTDKVPLWVAEHVKPENLAGSLKREDKFLPDPELAKGDRAELIDYRGSGFDRGHMAPAGNQSTDAARKAETFYLSNMVPQEGDLNRRLWRELEEQVRDAAQNRGAWVITGPMFYAQSEPDPAKATIGYTHRVIGPNHVGVPSHTYKIVLMPSDPGKYTCVAYVAANVSGYAPPHELEKYIVTVEFIEQRTGLNFFPALSDAARAELELKKGELHTR